MRVVIAAGGTGGHMYPAIAYARAFQQHDPKGDVLFVGPGKVIEQTILRQEGFPVEAIHVEGFVGRNTTAMLRALCLLPRSVWRALQILRAYKADLVIGTGGYFSPPVIVAAWLLRIPRVLLEPNAFPGLANRLVGPLANRIFLAFESAKQFFSAKNVQTIGTPIREAFILEHPPAPPERVSHILIFGGSQGAQAINAAVLDAIEQSEMLRASGTFTHQTGHEDYERVRTAYEQLGVSASVQPFLFDMPKELAKADLVICRAGASTLAELAAYGKGSILIPFPHATHNHQEKNAKAAEECGAARVLKQSDLTGVRLAKEIERLMNDIPALQSMAQCSWQARKTRATEHMVRECWSLVHGKTDHIVAQ